MYKNSFECIPDEVENRLNQIAKMHKDGYRSVIGIVMQYFLVLLMTH